MRLKNISNETEYEAALERIDGLMEAKPGSGDFDELQRLARLVDVYESKVHPIDPPPDS